ncbi:hypothetical protein CAEBREN_25417 [Caenorhabditis brenneri]|uniref:Uncharacterized protein n=1 Tax=Caenorhabditis brenneri TaxID=135651 RepID=G0NT88_CAEBE|nr:hypothetical protein CAEBREN_25417 [Caenorhabditis brenneri]
MTHREFIENIERRRHGKKISLDSKGFIKNIKFPENNFKVKHIPHINMHKNKKVSEVLKSDTTTSAGIHGSCGLKEREAMQIREVYKAVLSVSTDSSGQPNEDMEKLSSNTNGFYFDIKVRKKQINDMGDQLYLSTCKMYRSVSPIPSPNCFSFKKYLQEVDELFYRCNYKLHEAAKEKWDQMEQAEFKKETYGKISELDRNLVFIAGGLE